MNPARAKIIATSRSVGDVPQEAMEALLSACLAVICTGGVRVRVFVCGVSSSGRWEEPPKSSILRFRVWAIPVEASGNGSSRVGVFQAFASVE